MSAVVYRVRSLLRSRRESVVATAAAVGAVSALVLVLAAGAVRTLGAPDRYIRANDDGYDVSLEQSDGPPRTTEVAALPAVAAIETATFVFGGVIPDGSQDPADALVFAGDAEAFGLHVTEGRDPDPDRKDEFVATSDFARVSGAGIGDRFTLLTFSPESAAASGFDGEPDGPTIEATLVGITSGAASVLQDDTYAVAFPAALIEDGDVGIAASESVVALAPGATTDDLRAQLDALPDGSSFGIDPLEIVPSSVRDAVDARGNGIAVVAAIVALAGVVVLGQLVVRQARSREPQAAVLRAMGASSGQLVGESLVFAAVPVVSGVVGGALLAVALSGAFPLGFVSLVETDRGTRFEPSVHVLGSLLLVLAVMTWAAVALVFGGGARHSRSPRWAEHLASKVRRPAVATGIRFAFGRSSARGGTGLALTGLVLMLGGLVAATTFGTSLELLLDHPQRWGDVPLIAGAGGGDVPDDVRATLEADPDIEDLSYGGTILSSVGAKAIDISAQQPVRGDDVPHVFSGRLPVADDEIALGRVTARKLHVGVGDQIAVGEQQQPFTVSGIIVVPSIEGGDGVGVGGFVTPDVLRALDPGAQFASVRIGLRAGAPADSAERISDAIGMAVGAYAPPSSILNLRRIRAVPFVVAGSLAALVALSLGHQLLQSVRRRRRDVAVLRALGADRRFVAAVLHAQASVVVGATLVLAIPLGVLLGRTVYRTFIDRIGARDDVLVSPLWLVLAVVALLALANVIGALAARAARRAAPSRYLATE